MSDTAYVVVSGDYSARGIFRVYLDRTEAYRFVDQYNAIHSDSLDIEEREIGCDSEYDGPGFWGHWRPGWNEVTGGFVRPSWYTGPNVKAQIRKWAYGIDVSGTDERHCVRALQEAAAQWMIDADQ
jgi:hypothetical protein